MLAFHHIVLIALIQGITEFLPVSSSGHLVLLPALTGLEDQGQLIDVAAHIGTLGAVTLYFWRDCWQVLCGMLGFGSEAARNRRLGWLLILASLPVMGAGIVLELWQPAILRLAVTVAVANILFAFWLLRADQGSADKSLSDITLGDALRIGLAQILALIPGASRSGVTMTMGRQLGYDRLSVARFSLLLSIPVILAAGAVKSVSLIKTPDLIITNDVLLVMVLSFVTALIAIKMMMGWLARADFRIFVVYRLVLGAGLLAALAVGGI